MGVEARQLRPGVGGPPTPAPELLNAPLFRSLYTRLEAGGRWTVLDLGVARGATVRAFGRYRCRLDIADVAPGLDELNGATDPRAMRQCAEALLLPRRDEPLDIVLCWDLINYLNQPALTVLMDCIALRCKRGALAHGLVYYSARTMPARPSTFVPVDDEHLAQVVIPPGERPAPRYTPEDLARCMPRYRVERGRLLRNGMQEFLFLL